MVCEGILNYFGTSSEELLAQGAQKAREIYEPQIQKLTSEKDLLFSENNLLSSKNILLQNEINALKHLLEKNSISY